MEDEAAFSTVRRLVEHEDYALGLMQRHGLPSPRSLGIVELTPGREYLLVTEFLHGAVELGEVEVDEAVVDDGLGIVRTLWDSGLAHRDIKPANLLLHEGKVALVDVSFAQVRPSPWRQAINLANMMLVLALRCDAATVYRRALRQFTVDEIGEAFAATRGITMPSQVRHMLKAQGRDLHDEFVRLPPSRPTPISIQRWSWRRALWWLGIAFMVLMVFANPSLIWNTDFTDRTPLYLDRVDCTRLEPLWLSAQAVPSASLVPRVRTLPSGWRLGGASVNEGRSEFVLDSGRAGLGAVVVRLTATRDPGPARDAPSGRETVRRQEHVREQAGPAGFLAYRYDQFPGGCVTWELRSGPGADVDVVEEASMAIGYLSRDALGDALEGRSGGRLRLDAGAGRADP